jgi:hypothetical protein
MLAMYWYTFLLCGKISLVKEQNLHVDAIALGVVTPGSVQLR